MAKRVIGGFIEKARPKSGGDSIEDTIIKVGITLWECLVEHECLEYDAPKKADAPNNV